ncbi:MAG: DHA2 family efflux MFS transporter permease subunit [Limisphaerales bacterium]
MPDPIKAPHESGRLDSSIWKTSSVVVLGSFLSQLDATVVNVSLSSLAVTFHSSLSAIQWVTSGYLLALALILPLSGWMVDRIGAKALYLWCFSAFTFCSAFCGLAWSVNSLIGFRILQGMSGGLLAPMAQMMMARVAGKHMAGVLSFAAMPILLAPLLGPVIAGAILQFASWRWLFLINLPVGALALVLAVLFLPNDREETKPRDLDLVGLALLSPGLVLFLYGSEHISKDRAGLASLAGSVLLLVAFFKWATRKKEKAIIDLQLFTGKVFSAAAATQFMANGISFAGQMLIPIFLIRACGRSPGATGLLLAPLGLGMMCGYPFVGALTKRFGNRRVSAGGGLLALAGTLPFVYLAGHGLVIAILACALFLRGMGQSAVGTPSISAAYSSVKREDLPMASTTLNIVMRIGGPTLTTICATFLGWRLASAHSLDAMHDAFTAAFILLCTLHGLLIAAAMRLPPSVEGGTKQINPAASAVPLVMTGQPCSKGPRKNNFAFYGAGVLAAGEARATRIPR